MFYFRITNRQQKLLIEILKKNKTDIKYSFYCGFFILESHEDIEKCFDYLLDCFVNDGLLQNDEPNEYGFEIENINQIINHQLVLNNSEKEFEQKHQTIYLNAKTIFLNCNGCIDNLDDKTKTVYKKYNIPKWIEENWFAGISNTRIEEKLKHK